MEKEHQIVSGKCRDLFWWEDYLDDRETFLDWQYADGMLYIKGNVEKREKAKCAFGVFGWEFPFNCFSDRWHTFAPDVKCVSIEAGCNAMIMPGHWVFRDVCDFSGLEKVIIPEGVKVVVGQAFCECTSIREISIPNSVRIIESCFLRM